MKRINSRQKGARGERAFRDLLRAEGYLSARRGQQFCGGADSPDIICPELDFIHWEVKSVEKLNLYDALAQARRDCGSKVPVVAHRRNYWPWLVTLETWELFNGTEGWLAGGCFFARPVCRRLGVQEAMAKACREAKGRAAFVLHRRNSQTWLVTMKAETFFQLLRGEVPGIPRCRLRLMAEGRGHGTEGNNGAELTQETISGGGVPSVDKQQGTAALN